MITVCFRKGGHPAYDEIFNYPPNGVKYKEIKFLKGKGGSDKSLLFKIKKQIFEIYKNLKYQGANIVPIYCNGDIIFSCGGLLPDTNLPWITDVEHGASLIGYNKKDITNKRKILLTVKFLTKSRCMILPWSLASKISITNIFGKYYHLFEDKIKVVYPAVSLPQFKKKFKQTDKITFLYISRLFWGKCGYEVLEAFNEISKKYDTELIFVSNTPKEIEKKFQKNSNIKFIQAPIPRIKILELYKKADVFVLPTLFDTFGFVYLEAMSFGLPIIATNVFAVPEIVEHKKNGLLIKPEYCLFNDEYLFRFDSCKSLINYTKKNLQYTLIDSLKKYMKQMIERDNERKTLGKNSLKILNKKFSIKRRNKTLREIYENLIKI